MDWIRKYHTSQSSSLSLRCRADPFFFFLVFFLLVFSTLFGIASCLLAIFLIAFCIMLLIPSCFLASVLICGNQETNERLNYDREMERSVRGVGPPGIGQSTEAGSRS